MEYLSARFCKREKEIQELNGNNKNSHSHFNEIHFVYPTLLNQIPRVTSTLNVHQREGQTNHIHHSFIKKIIKPSLISVGPNRRVFVKGHEKVGIHSKFQSYIAQLDSQGSLKFLNFQESR